MLCPMRLDSATLTRLRDELRDRGARPSLPPPAGVSAPAAETCTDVLAIMERIAPICEVLYLLMVDHDARELEVLRGIVRALTDGKLKTLVLEGMLARFEAALAAHGREHRLAQVAGQLAADRQDAEAAFVLASVMAIADELPNEHERRMLSELREQLGISPARAQALLGEAARAP
jgi:hypothetical protein